MPTLLGIEIGGTKLQMVVGDASGQIVDRRRFQIAREQGADGIRDQISTALPELLKQHQPVSIGVGFGGPVHPVSGRVATSHQIPGWSGFELADWLTDLTGVRVRVDNDANVAALGEAVSGAGRGFSPVFYVTLGSGVGGGLVADARIYHGAAPGESEIGHIRLDKTGTLVEQRCSGWAVDRRIREGVASHPDSILAGLLNPEPGGEARHLRSALDQNDPWAIRLLEETAEDLAFGLSHVTQLFHPETIVLGGGLSLVGEPLRAAVETHHRRFIMDVFGNGPEILLSGLGEDAVPVGSLLLAGGLRHR